MKTLALVMGTRPEIIKLAPLVSELSRSSLLKPFVIASGQHSSMARQVFDVFGLEPDVDLGLMREGQTPSSFLGALLTALEPALTNQKLSGVVVQGDTTTALGGALAGFHLRLPVFHVEAGLRTFNMSSPFPEEMNRAVISKLATLHFAPTDGAVENLVEEGIIKGVHQVGNTVVDAVLEIKNKLEKNLLSPDPEITALTAHNKQLLLVTGHRRENFDTPMRTLCEVLLRLRDADPELEILYPVHRNPNVDGPVRELLSNQARIHLTAPLDYPTLVQVLSRATLVISDSGGIQEEAPSFGKKVLVTRDTTERGEAVEAGAAVLCPLSQPEKLFEAAIQELNSPASQPKDNPFGDGTSAMKIREILEDWVTAR